MSRFDHNRDGIEISTTVTLCEDDITSNLDFSDILEMYEPKTRDVCDLLDTDEVIGWAVQQPDFTRPETIRAIMENNDVVIAILEYLKEDRSEVMEVFTPKAPEPPKIEFQSVAGTLGIEIMKIDGITVGSITVQMDQQLYCSITEKDGGVLRFACKNLSTAYTLMRGVAQTPALDLDDPATEEEFVDFGGIK
jgi:hypothetical protein